MHRNIMSDALPYGIILTLSSDYYYVKKEWVGFLKYKKIPGLSPGYR